MGRVSSAKCWENKILQLPSLLRPMHLTTGRLGDVWEFSGCLAVGVTYTQTSADIYSGGSKGWPRALGVRLKSDSCRKRSK